MKKLVKEYTKKKNNIRKRLKEFKNAQKRRNKDIFTELCFCLLTPQSKAVNCDKAIKELKKTGLLLDGSECDIKTKLRGFTRFHNKKARYLVAARDTFGGKEKLNIKKYLDSDNILKTRDWMVHSIKGLGYKEASHFLRNIGFGKDIAILDVHILNNLKKYGVIEKIPSYMAKKDYVNIENKMREFAKRLNISLEELDLLFWSCETGFVFK